MLRLLFPLALVASTLLTSGCASFIRTQGDQEKAKLHLQVAIDRFTAREYGPAIEATQEAIRLDPQLAEAYNHLALVYLETKRFVKAEEAFRQALNIRPEYPEVLNNLGVLFNRQEKYELAISNFEKALAIEKYVTPENAYTNLGYAYYRLGNLARSKAYHQRALDVSPEFCLASKNMGDVYAKEKNYAKAADYFQKAMTQCPLYQESEYKLGLVMMKQGQRDTARARLEKLVKRHKQGPYVDRSNEVLKYLR